MVDNNISKLREERAEKLAFIARYVIVGLTTPVLYLLLLWLIVHLTSIAHWLASSASYLLAVIYQFYMHSLYTFKVASNVANFQKFIITVLTGILLSYLLMEALPFWIDNQLIISAFVIVVVTPIFNFILFSNWVFSRSHD